MQFWRERHTLHIKENNAKQETADSYRQRVTPLPVELSQPDQEVPCHSPLPAGVRTASMAFIGNQKEWDMATPRRSNLLVKSYLRCSLTAKW